MVQRAIVRRGVADIESPVGADLEELRVIQDREDFRIDVRVNALQELASGALPDQFRTLQVRQVGDFLAGRRIIPDFLLPEQTFDDGAGHSMFLQTLSVAVLVKDNAQKIQQISGRRQQGVNGRPIGEERLEALRPESGFVRIHGHGDKLLLMKQSASVKIRRVEADVSGCSFDTERECQKRFWKAINLECILLVA